MNVISFAQLVMRRWWLAVGLAVAGAVLGVVIQSSLPARYESIISLQLNPAAKSAFLPYLSAEQDGATIPAGAVPAMAASYRELLKSRTFGQLVVQQLKLKVPPEAIAYSINTTLVPNTNILRLGVTWDNPGDAQQLTQRIAEIFINENLRVQQSEPTTQARLSELEQSAREMQQRRTPLQQQRDRLDQAVAHGDFSRLNELNDLDQRLTQLGTTYANLQVEMSRIRGSFDTAYIVDRAGPAISVSAVTPIQAAVFGVLGGLAAGIGLSLLLDYLGDAVRSARDVLGATGIPPLGRVRHAQAWGLRRRNGALSRALVMLNSERSLAAEAFRSLRTSIYLNAPHRNLHVLVVTSPGSGEGKSFVASNLAVALAQSGKRVLLVDADLRRPAVHRIFGVSNTLGLVDALRRAAQMPAPIAVSSSEGAASPAPAPIPGVIASSIENLWLLPAGTPPRNPGELLSSEALGGLMEEFTAQWDMVILDTAPIGTIADTLLLAKQASGCLLVARWGRTRRAALSGAISALRGLGRPLVGVVLNDERPGVLSRFSRDDYYQHGYWSEIPAGDAIDGVEGWQGDLAHALDATTLIDAGTLDGGGGTLRPDATTRRPRRSPHGRAE
jgi:Mrp family chromosome partitioning ATPase/capsular polysaccharide biosynthesis protein